MAADHQGCHITRSGGGWWYRRQIVNTVEGQTFAAKVGQAASFFVR